MSQKLYQAFISYSHSDEDFGSWLHRELEKYKIPKRLYDDYPNLPKSLYPIFRDRYELNAGDNLGIEITKALEHTKALIVVCSKSSANSKWVNKEIIDFKMMYGEDNIFPIIIDGEPFAKESNKFDDSEECFPDALKYKIDSDGNLTDETTDILASSTIEKEDGQELAKLKLIAGLLGVPFGEFHRRDLEQKRKDRNRNIVIWGLVLLIMLGLTVFSWIQRDNAIKNEKVAQEQTKIAETRLKRAESNLLVTRSNTEAEAAPDKALSLALDAWEHDKENLVAHHAVLRSYYVPNAFPVHLLQKNLPNRSGTAISYFAQAFEKDSKSIWVLDRADSKRLINTSFNGVRTDLVLTKSVYDFRIDPKGDGFLTVNKSGATLWDRNGTIIQEFPYSGASFATIAPDGKRVMVTGGFEGGAQIFSREGEELTRLCCHGNTIKHGDFATGENGWISTSGDKKTYIWNAKGELQYTIEHEDYVTSATISPNGEFFTTTTWDSRVQIWWLKTGKILKSLLGHSSRVYSASFSPDGEKLVTVSWDGTARIWDARSMHNEVLLTLPTIQEQNVVTWSPDGNWIVASGSKTVTLWNVTATKYLPLGFGIGNEMKPELMTYKSFTLKGSYRDVSVLKDGKEFFSFETPFKDRIYKRNFSEKGQFIDTTSNRRFPFSPEAIRDLVYTQQRFGPMKRMKSE